MSQDNLTVKNVPTAKEAVEFLPDALEIQQQRLPWYARIGIGWILLIVLSVLVWACVSKVDVIVNATGRIVSKEGDIVMKPLESAVIKTICVKEGDVVEAGQVLIEFDPAINQAEVDRLNQELVAVTAEYERYRAEFEGREYAPANPEEHNAGWQLSIYQQRKAYYREKINYYDSNVSRIKAAKNSTQESYQKYQEILVNMKKIEGMYDDLLAKNVVAYKESLEVTMDRMKNEVEVDLRRNELVEYEQQILSADAERKAFVEEWRNNISEKLVELNREISSDRKQLAKYERLLSYVNLRSPCKALVHEMASFPVGSAVGDAEAVITLVPLDKALEIEAEIRPQDISHVHIGSEARIKLSAFPFQKHGTLDGKIRLISGNTFQRSTPTPLNPETTYYRGYLTFTGKLRNTRQEIQYIPGMETQVEIKADKRRIIEYLIYPLIKGLDEAFREL